MWIIASGISLALVMVLASHGLSGIPFEWYGVAAGVILASVAFMLGFAE